MLPSGLPRHTRGLAREPTCVGVSSMVKAPRGRLECGTPPPAAAWPSPGLEAFEIAPPLQVRATIGGAGSAHTPELHEVTGSAPFRCRQRFGAGASSRSTWRPSCRLAPPLASPAPCTRPGFRQHLWQDAESATNNAKANGTRGRALRPSPTAFHTSRTLGRGRALRPSLRKRRVTLSRMVRRPGPMAARTCLAILSRTAGGRSRRDPGTTMAKLSRHPRGKASW